MKNNFLQQIFNPPTKLKKSVQAECQENHDSDNFHNGTEICKLEASFQALNDSVMDLIETLEETENDKYLLKRKFKA